MIIWLFLVTFSVDYVLILRGEIRCWSVLEFIGLRQTAGADPNGVSFRLELTVILQGSKLHKAKINM